MRNLLKTVYGSHLYGTNTPTSDYDYKVVYLPAFEDVLLGRKLRTFKERVDAEGRPVADNAVMPDNGVETEFVPFQTFCTDYLNGQTYALEIVQFQLCQATYPVWVKELAANFTTCNVSSMAGFAMKQTFDYVHRGQRLAAAERLLKELKRVHDFYTAADRSLTVRLDTPVAYASDEGATVQETVLDGLARECQLELGTTVNNGRTMRTLKLNGRDYLETTTVQHLQTAVEKLVASYGHRSTAAKENEVDLKSLSHAVRVYEQCVELLTVGKMVFPRFERAYLLNVKKGNVPLEEVKARLLELEERVAQLQATSSLLPEKTPALQARFDEWLLGKLRELYDLR